MHDSSASAPMTLHIKNMVCNRCIAAVNALLTELRYTNFHTGMGWVHLAEAAWADDAKSLLSHRLQDLGFELIDDRKGRTIEAIKNMIIQKIQHEDLFNQHFVWSDLIAEALHYDYKYLSTLFSSVEGVTIEQFIILQKIEKAKELIAYDELSLMQIADRLGYSNVPHLSNQFKKVTGMPPGKFRQIGADRRKPLDDLGVLQNKR